MPSLQAVALRRFPGAQRRSEQGCRGTDGKFPVPDFSSRRSFTLSPEGELRRATAFSSVSCVFDSHVAKFSEVLIERGNWGVFGSCSRGDYAIHEMNLRPSISV